MDQHSPDLAIEIRDCNSISDAKIALRESALNIKYGANGVGKSTIARALQLRAGGDGSLDPLVPFKHRGINGAPSPSVVGADTIEKVLVFDDDYVSQFVFRPEFWEHFWEHNAAKHPQKHGT